MPINPVLPPPKGWQPRRNVVDAVLNARTADDLLLYDWIQGKSRSGKTVWTDEDTKQKRYQEKKPGTGRGGKKAAGESAVAGGKPEERPEPAGKKPAKLVPKKVDVEAVGDRIQKMVEGGEFSDQDLFELKESMRGITRPQLAALRERFKDLGVKAGRSNEQGVENLAGGVAGRRKAKEAAPTPEPSPDAQAAKLLDAGDYDGLVDLVSKRKLDAGTLDGIREQLIRQSANGDEKSLLASWKVFAVKNRYDPSDESGMQNHADYMVRHADVSSETAQAAMDLFRQQSPQGKPTEKPHQPTRKPPIAIGEEDVAGIVGGKKPGKGTGKPVDDREARIQAHRERVAREGGAADEDEVTPAPQKPAAGGKPKQPRQPRKKPTPPPMPEPEDDGFIVVPDEDDVPVPGAGPAAPVQGLPAEPSQQRAGRQPAKKPAPVPEPEPESIDLGDYSDEPTQPGAREPDSAGNDDQFAHWKTKASAWKKRAAEPMPQQQQIDAAEQAIKKAARGLPIASIAELRKKMPPEMRGRAFDEAIFKLADSRQGTVSQDAHPARFTDDELGEYVQDGDGFLTTISFDNNQQDDAPAAAPAPGAGPQSPPLSVPPEPSQEKSAEKPPAQRSSKPVPGQKSGATPQELGQALKEAYDYQKLFVEHRDGTIPLNRVYHEMLKRVPDLTKEQFHNLVKQLSDDRRVELDVLNETHMADDDHADHAIGANDRMYNYLRLKPEVKGGGDLVPSKEVGAEKKHDTWKEHTQRKQQGGQPRLNARSPVGILLNARSTAMARPLLYAWTRKRPQASHALHRPSAHAGSNAVPVEEALRRVLEAPYRATEQQLSDLRGRLARLKPAALAALDQMFPAD